MRTDTGGELKYIVDLSAERVEVELAGGRAVVDGADAEARLVEVAGTPVRLVTIGDRVHRVIARRTGERGAYTLWVDGWRYDAEALDERRRAIRDLSAARAEAGGPAPLVAPMPGLIVRIGVAVGDEVAAGQSIVVMEAMKMENELRTTSAGRVTRINAEVGSTVDRGAVVVELG